MDEEIHGISMPYAAHFKREILLLGDPISLHAGPQFFHISGIFPCNTGVQKCEP